MDRVNGTKFPCPPPRLIPPPVPWVEGELVWAKPPPPPPKIFGLFRLQNILKNKLGSVKKNKEISSLFFLVIIYLEILFLKFTSDFFTKIKKMN